MVLVRATSMRSRSSDRSESNELLQRKGIVGYLNDIENGLCMVMEDGAAGYRISAARRWHWQLRTMFCMDRREQNVASQQTSILRVKRKRNEEPLDALGLSRPSDP
jgi:hypothetical protein